ncbi:MAG: S1C family serine protease [Candidatus Bathyarchaeia archaeon]
MSYDENTVLDIIEKTSKSVVNISTVKLVHNIFYRAVPVGGMGSGTIIDGSGLILTNNHVVGGAEKINVTLHNNQVVEGTIAGSCAMQDIAVIKINAKDIEPAQLGDSDKLRMGQRVFAIGNPFGLAGGPSVTSGVVSAINRTIESERGLIENLVQTDAAINPGNSGGPLVDVSGKVVAINTAIIPYAQGIGFAIPINSAKACTNEVMSKGVMHKAWLGIVGLTLTPQIARYYGFPVDYGVLVTKVALGSPAHTGGMVDGDIILQVGNRQTRTIEELVDEVHKRSVGEVVRVFAVRNGRQHYFDLKLSEAP